MSDQRVSLRAFLELFALNGFVVVQPVLDVMGRSPDFFLFRRADRWDIVALAAFLVVVPPLVLWAVESAVGLVAGSRARRPVHLALVGLLLALLAVQVAKDAVSLSGLPLVVVAVAAGAGLALAYHRFDGIRTWLAYLAVAPVLFAGLFLGASEVSNLVFPEEAAEAADVGTRDTPVVVLFLDEFPLMALLDEQGQIDAELYPSFARLASQSTWLRNATGVSGYTPVAMPAMVTGRWPQGGRAPSADQFPETLFTLLGNAYDVTAYETITALCPSDLCNQGTATGPTGAGALVGDAGRVWREIVTPRESARDITQSLQEETAAERPAPQHSADTQFGFGALEENQPARFTDFLAEIDGAQPSSLWFLHLLMPHAPYRYLPSGMQYGNRIFGKDDDDRWLDEEWVVTHVKQRLLLQTVYTDGLLGQVIDRLEAEGLWDDAVFVLAADHGLGTEAGYHARSMTPEDPANADGLAWVPFFVKAPGQTAGEVRDDNVITIDIVPTIADLLDVEIPWEVDGLSVVGDERRTTDEKRFVGTPDVTLSTAEWFPQVLRGLPAELGTITEVASLFRVGPGAELIGRPAPTGPAEGTAVVDALGRYRDVDPASGTVPALLTGRLSREADALAVGLNGEIVAVSGTFQENGQLRFAALIPDGAFRPGENRLELFVISADGSMEPLSVEDA
jgi:hypothetical protein